MFQVTGAALAAVAVFCWPLRVAARAVPVRAVSGTLIVTAATAAPASQVRRILRRLPARRGPGRSYETASRASGLPSFLSFHRALQCVFCEPFCFDLPVLITLRDD